MKEVDTNMNIPFFHIPDIAAEVEIPKGGIISRTLHSDGDSRIVAFGFDTGQELTEHTSTMQAMLYFVSGEATVSLGTETMEVGPGAFSMMRPQLPHSIVAKSPLVMLLVMIPVAKHGI